MKPRQKSLHPGSGSVGWILVLSIVGYPLVAGLVEILSTNSRVLTVPFRALVAAASLWAILSFVSKKSRFKVSIFWMSWVAFWVLYLSRLAIDVRLYSNSIQLPEWEYWLYAAGVSLMPAVAAGIRTRHTSGISTSRCMILFSAVAILFNLAVLISNYGLELSYSSNFLRAETESLNPIALGHLGVTCAILSVWTVITDRRAFRSHTIFYLITLSVGLLGIAMSGSRGPVLSLAIVLSLMLWHSSLFIKLLSILLICLGSIFLAFNPSLLDSYLIERVTTHMWEDSVRANLLSEAFQLIEKYPISGNGIDPLPVYPHNIIVEAFMVGGVPMGALLCVMLTISMWKAVTLNSLSHSFGWVSLIFVQYMIAAMVSGSIYIVSPMWVAMAAMMTLSTGGGKTGAASQTARSSRHPIP
ncbi:MAG: hypothetical protein WC284_08880 [Candidimonas sp.]